MNRQVNKGGEGEMKLLRRIVAVLVVVGVAGSVGLVMASNMGFKENKQVFQKVVPAPVGRNLVALPANNPYTNAQGICEALTLPGGGPTVTQIEPNGGVSSTYFCDPLALPSAGYALLDLIGVIVDNLPADDGGILVGSHRPSFNYTIWEQRVPAPKGRNLYSVPFHTTNQNMQAVCIDWGLNVAPFVGNASISRTDADAGVTQTYFCVAGGPAASTALVLGEAVFIVYTDGTVADITLNKNPSHF